MESDKLEKLEKPIPNNNMGSTYIPFPKEFIEYLKQKDNK
jgi:hypothetical protein